MKFSNAALVEQVVWDMRLADLPRGTNRALIDRLANGNPPWSQQEAEEAQINTNVNWLEFPKLIADARRSYANAFMKPGQFFNIMLDYGGKPSKRREWGRIITREINKAIKNSPDYFEFLRSQSALTVLHGIGPGFWHDKESWCPRCLSLQDVLIPSNTLLTLSNLTHFAIFRQFTPMELRIMTEGKNVDPAWNLPLVESALNWADQQTRGQLAYSDLYAPQNVEERWKQDLGFYGTDAVPTVDCWDFYYWSTEGDKHGWRRRMILDTPTGFEVGSNIPDDKRKMSDKNLIGQEHGEWLYCPDDDRVYADKIRSILHFQFGDASAVAPFRYHSVRSLGWLLYAVCHLQNRLRCKLNDAIFESLLQYFRASNPDDKERITKIDLHNYGIIPEGIDFVKPQDRWQIDQALVGLGLGQNRAMMDESAAQYREGRDVQADSKEKTATQIMAEVNAANALVGSMLLQAYQYQKYQYMEIARRFCISGSRDMDVMNFRKCVLQRGVPPEVLNVDYWEIEPERVLGSGNKTLEIAMADKLMAARNLHDPEAQRKILRIYDMANSDNPGLTDELVPETPSKNTDSVHDAQLMVGSIMNGTMFTPKEGQNAIEIIDTLLVSLAGILQKTAAKGPAASMDDVIGMGAMIGTIQQYVKIVSGDKNEKERVKNYVNILKKLGAEIQKLAGQIQQQMQQQAQAGQGQQGGPDAATKADLQGKMMMDAAKAKNAEAAAQQKLQHKDAQFKQKMAQDAQRHQLDVANQLQQVKVDTAAADLETAASIKRDSAQARLDAEMSAQGGDNSGEE